MCTAALKSVNICVRLSVCVLSVRRSVYQCARRSGCQCARRSECITLCMNDSEGVHAKHPAPQTRTLPIHQPNLSM